MEITELQKDLAATFRWTARLNMHEGVANHFSACVPGSSTDFYVNKAGLHFSQIKASDIILVTKDNIEELKKNRNKKIFLTIFRCIWISSNRRNKKLILFSISIYIWIFCIIQTI